MKKWVKDTVTKFGFDGLRVDTTPEVKREFWKEYSEAAGVFTIGEVFNGNVNYVASYQGSALDATLNYPFYFTLRSVFAEKGSMSQIRTLLDTEKTVFQDHTLLGLFIDNHDNERWLHHNGSIKMLKNALAYVLSAEGIPIMYYGTEQAFNGGNDPDDREPLWPTGLKTDTEMYQFVKAINQARKSQKWFEQAQVERYAEQSFYAFTRGDTLVVMTNDENQQITRTITYSEYKGGILTNIFDENDKINVGDDGSYSVTINGEPKIYTY